MGESPIVYVVDDDISVRESLEMRFVSLGLRCEIFDKADAFLSRERDACPACLVLDCRLPDLDGFEVHRRAASESLPVVFITAFGDIPAAVRAMKAGAIEYLTKPFSEDSLLGAIRQGLARSRAALDRDDDKRALLACYDTLSRRERQVMALVSSGLSNKVAGGRLGVCEQTVKAHRGRVMRKMKASSLADLVRKAAVMRQSSTWQEP